MTVFAYSYITYVHTRRSKSSEDEGESVNKRLSKSLGSIFKGRNRANFFKRANKKENLTTNAVGNETYQPGSTQSDETDEYDGM